MMMLLLTASTTNLEINEWITLDSFVYF